MRTLRLCSLLGWLASTAFDTTPAAEAERSAFLYRNKGNQGALVHDYANRWVEFVGSDDRFGFVETARSGDSLWLTDFSRDVGLRVRGLRVEIRLPGSKAWKPWGEGRWISPAELPDSIQFVPTDWKVRLVYFVPSDRRPIDDYARRVRVVMALVDDIYRADLKAKGYQTAEFPFERDSQGEPVVRLVRGPRPASHYNGAPEFKTGVKEHFARIARDLPARLGSPRRHLIVVFAETYDPGPAPVEWRGSLGVGNHESADGGLAVMSAWILRDEFCAGDLEGQKRYLRDATPIPGRAAFGTKRMNSPRFEFIEDGFGAVAHEVGHALGLPHDTRSPDDIMGQGFRRLRLNYPATPAESRPVAFSRDNARLLAVSRYLSAEVDRSDNIPPKAEVRIQPGASPVVTLWATDDRALRAVVFVDPAKDTIVGGAELTGRSQTLEYTLPRLVPKPGKTRTPPRLVTLLADVGGNIARIETTVPSP